MIFTGLLRDVPTEKESTSVAGTYGIGVTTN